MLARFIERVKEWGSTYKTDILLGSIVFLMSVTSFGLGRLSVLWTPHAPLQIITPEFTAASDKAGERSTVTTVSNPTGQVVKPTRETATSAFVASKNGSKYYPADCAAAKRIKPENLITFQTAADAERAGYQPAANCP